ncbi:MAG: imidazole glycerol phosphate synthase subunit HisF [Gammaproteobacteria bacterium]
MLAKRIIPCLDVKDGKVVKGVRFREHQVVGDIVELAELYCQAGADELVFYDITASSEQRSVSKTWVKDVARKLDIPFCVAGGIRSLADAEVVLNSGADKISINTPALENPALINQLADTFGVQCVVIGVDSLTVDDDYQVYQYTGDPNRTCAAKRSTLSWIEEIQQRGAGEIVLNCMDQDGVRQGYDIEQLKKARAMTTLPLIASGGAGNEAHFYDVFDLADVDGALAASVFHRNIINIGELKKYLKTKHIEVRL